MFHLWFCLILLDFKINLYQCQCQYQYHSIYLDIIMIDEGCASFWCKLVGFHWNGQPKK